MSYFSEVTHTECVNRMSMVVSDQRTITRSDQQILDRLPSAIAEYLARGGKITELPRGASEDTESDESVQRRKDRLRQYDLNHDRKRIKALNRGK